MKFQTTLTGFSVILLSAVVMYSQSSGFSNVQNMGSTINSASDDQGGAMAPNGLSLYFTSNRPGGLGGQDIYVSQRATLGSPWGAPQNLGATINSAENELAPSFSRDGLMMFFTSNRSGGMGNNDIYILTRTNANNDFGWTVPANAGAVINTQFSERGATYFEDSASGINTLTFAREFDSTMVPFHDLYQCRRNADGTFDAPTLITELNSVGSEIRATYRSDGLEVFIHTSRPGGFSPAPPATPTFDIFVSTRTSTTAPWNAPVLVAGLNTVLTEGGPALSPDGSILYFQSNRPGGLGGNDLYTATRCSLYAAAACSTNRSAADFDGDGRTDISVFRPSDGIWYTMNSATNTFTARQFGTNGDKVVPGDYDGDGRTDMAVFRPSTGAWWIQKSSDNSLLGATWGLAADRLVPADYDGDGKTDIAVFRDGTWYILQSSDGGVRYQQFGLTTDVPITTVGIP